MESCSTFKLWSPDIRDSPESFDPKILVRQSEASYLAYARMERATTLDIVVRCGPYHS